jgi:cytosine/adenosine deaminase-related metal-dependent hydrolase
VDGDGPWPPPAPDACPVEILRGATLYAAQSLDLADEFGTIEPGKTADVLILDANPLERIENIRSVWRVVYDGRVLPSGGNNEQNDRFPVAPAGSVLR